jgi:hypothetical protein
VLNLMARRLPHIEDRLPLEVVRLDLVRHHRTLPPTSGADRRVRVRGAAAP